MPWRTTTFERESLYREVWAEPVRSVAKRYGLSDVGLRKICGKLGMPLPPLGYWAKLAVGKQPRVTPLPTKHAGPTAHVRQLRFDDRSEERAARVAALLAAHTASGRVAPILRGATDFHPIVVRTGNRLRAQRGGLPGALQTHGHDVFDLNLWPPQKDRALQVLDAVVTAAIASGARLQKGSRDGRQVSLDFDGDAVELEIEEVVSRTRREPTPAEAARQARDFWFKPDLWHSAPTGKLKLVLVLQDGRAPLVSVQDGATPLEKRLDDVLPRLVRKLAERRVEQQFRDEENARWHEAYARRRAQEARRSTELERLEKTEQFAEQWHRATRLRAYVAALETAARGPTAATDDVSLASELAWIRAAADWLDPLVERHWPEVDGEKPAGVDDS